MGGPLILMYNLDNLTGSKIRLLCLKLHIRVRDVKPAEYAQPIGTLAGAMPAPASQDASCPDSFLDEMLLMCHLDDVLFNAFLQGFRANKIPGVALKAILTPTNMAWNSVQLHNELFREHEAMLQRRGMAAKN